MYIFADVQIPFAIQWAWPIPLFALITLAPESPWFLVRQGRLEEAERAVARLGSSGAVSPSIRVAMMVRTNKLEIESNIGGSYLDCFKGTDLRRTEISCFTWACQPLCGLAFTGSAVYFLQQAGMDTSVSFQVNIGVSCMAFLGTCLSWIALTVSILAFIQILTMPSTVLAGPSSLAECWACRRYSGSLAACTGPLNLTRPPAGLRPP